MYEWASTVVVITGAASGIGAEVVRKLINEKVKHVAILDIAKETGDALQNELNEKYGDNKVKFYNCDVTDEEHLFKVFDLVVEEAGYIDVVINNAAICNDKTYKKEIQLNVTAVVSGTLKALELMRKDRGGRGGTVINVSSTAGMARVPEMPVYCATKAAVLHFTSSIASVPYHTHTGVRLLTMSYGNTDTTIFDENKISSFDDTLNSNVRDIINSFPMQKVESAARGLIEAYKRGKTASMWLAINDEPVKDITATGDKINEMYSEFILPK